MARNLPEHVRNLTPAPRVIHYADPVPNRGVVILRTEAEVQAWRARENQITLRNRMRLERIAEHDRKVRRFFMGFGAVVGGVFLIAVFVGGWLLWRYLAGFGLTAIGIVPVIALIASGLAVGGHRCITVVQHWH